MSLPSAPAEVGFYDTPGTAGGVAVAGNYAYVADNKYGLFILAYTPPLLIYLPLVPRNP